MHIYFVTRGGRRWWRRFIEELEDIYLPHINKKTKKSYGMIQVMPREVKLWECVLPKMNKKDAEKIIRDINKKHPNVAIKFLGKKKDKFRKDGMELL